MTDSSSRKGVATFPPPPQVSIRLLAFGESPRCHVGFHNGALFELDGVRMIWIGHFEMFLEVIAWHSHITICAEACDKARFSSSSLRN
jgi:hypothetical protein